MVNIGNCILLVKCQKQLKDIKTSVETGKYPDVDKLLAHNTNFGMEKAFR